MAKKILVVLDPGHYPNYNKGAVSGYFEGDKMYTLSEYERDALKEYGVDVVLTRERSNDLGLTARGQVAVTKGKGYSTVVFISNHSNAYNGKAYGVEIFRSLYLPGSEELAKKLLSAIVDVMNASTGVTTSRGVKTRKGDNGDYYGVIRGSVNYATSEAKASKGPVKYSFIIEHGFHDNVKECTFLNSNANLKKLAEAKAKVIADYFGLKKTVKKTETTTGGTFTMTMKSVRRGSKGANVKAMQILLIGNNFYCGKAGADGSCGVDTENAIKAYQKANGLTVDGSCGPKTWAKLLGV